MTRAQANQLAKQLKARYPNSPVMSAYNAGQWWVVFGVDYLGTPEAVREYEDRLAEDERKLIASLEV